MAVVGKSNLAGGVTTRRRVGQDSPAILERCSGWEIADGSAWPEKLVSRHSVSALGATLAEQPPAAFADPDGTKLICRDKDSKLRECSAAGAWSGAGDRLSILPESTPQRLGRQVIVCTDGPNPRVMVYEPGSPSTKLRPLALKAPTDYASGHKPAVTPSVSAAVQLFDIADSAGNRWVIADAAYGSVSNATDKAIITLDSDAPANKLVATRDISAATKGLTNKVFLVLDLMFQHDKEEIYPLTGLFANNAYLAASGYLIGLYSDGGCSNLIAAYRIPRATAQGLVQRIVINLGAQTATVQGVGILTEVFFAPPAGTNTAKITLWSEGFKDNWTHKGNFLLPAAKWNKSPWAAKLTALVGLKAGRVGLPEGGNILPDPSFELGDSSPWTPGSGGDITDDGARSGGWSLELDHTNEYGISPEITDGVIAGSDYGVDAWVHPEKGGTWHMEIQPYAGAAPLTLIRLPSSGSYSEAQNAGWVKRQDSFTMPTTATKFTIKPVADADHHDFYIDDVAVYAKNQVTEGAAAILQAFSEEGAGLAESTPRARWRHCFAGRDLLGTDEWELMVSNPSDPTREEPYTAADPWRTYDLVMTLPNGPIVTVAAAVTAGGSGYDVGDILAVDKGEGGKVKVLTIGTTPFPAATVELLKAGTNYAAAAGKETTNETDAGGTGCTIEITDVLTPLEEYGDYLTHVLIYRQIYDGDTQVWGTETFIGLAAIAASVPFSDIANDATLFTLEGRDIPEELEVGNDYPSWSSARYGCKWKGRVAAACLNWDEEKQVWQAPTMVGLSGYLKPWTWHTGAGDDYPNLEDGGLLYDFAVTGGEIRGMLPRDNDLLVFFDNEWFPVQGDSPALGYRIQRGGPVGLKSAKALANCGGIAIGHDGHHFVVYEQGPARYISEFAIDSTLIDWDKAHGAVYCGGEYVFFCEHDGDWCVMRHDLDRGGWRIRYSDALELVGIATDGQEVYGITPDGDAVNLQGSTTNDYGAAATVREIFTQYIALDAVRDHRITQGVIEAVTTEEAGVSFALEYTTQGQSGDTTTLDLDITPGQTRYHVDLDLMGSAVKIKATYSGETPPQILWLGVITDDYAPTSYGKTAAGMEWVRRMRLSDGQQDVRLQQACLEVISSGAATLTVKVDTLGLVDGSDTQDLAVGPGQTHYHLNLSGLHGYYATVTVSYSGGTPPEVYGINIMGDGDAPVVYGTVEAGSEWVRYVQLSEPGMDVRISQVVIEAEASGETALSVQVETYGLKNDSAIRNIALVAGKREYRRAVNLQGCYAKITATYTGETPPKVFSMRLVRDREAAK